MTIQIIPEWASRVVKNCSREKPWNRWGVTNDNTKERYKKIQHWVTCWNVDVKKKKKKSMKSYWDERYKWQYNDHTTMDVTTWKTVVEKKKEKKMEINEKLLKRIFHESDETDLSITHGGGQRLESFTSPALSVLLCGWGKDAEHWIWRYWYPLWRAEAGIIKLPALPVLLCGWGLAMALLISTLADKG